MRNFRAIWQSVNKIALEATGRLAISHPKSSDI